MKIYLLLAIMIVIASAFKYENFQKKPWPVPDAAKNKKNPIISNTESIEAGKALWAIHCKSCHGIKGLGDGPKADQLNTEPGDFSKAEMQSQTDGAIFYKTSEGRDDMPAFKKKIPAQDDIWKLVNYIRTFKKGSTIVNVTKDTISKKVEKQAKPDNPPIKKDTTENKVIPKTETATQQDQINRLFAKVDSLEKEVRMIKEKIDSLKKEKTTNKQ